MLFMFKTYHGLKKFKTLKTENGLKQCVTLKIKCACVIQQTNIYMQGGKSVPLNKTIMQSSLQGRGKVSWSNTFRKANNY